MEKLLRRSQFRLLTKHFFGRFFDSEMFATPGADMHLLAVQILGLLVIPGAFKTFMSIGKYLMLAMFPSSLVTAARMEQTVLADEYFFLCLSMILTGFITVFEWDSLFPDDRDFYNLAPLPIDPRVLYFAKVTALSFFIVLFNLAINGVPIFLFPGIVLTHSDTLGVAGTRLSSFESTMYYVGHATGLFLSSLFVFTSLIAIRSAIPLIFPAKLVRKASRFIQLALLLLLLCALFTGVKADRLVAEGNGWVYSMPPFWFVGFFEVLIGHYAPVYVTLAKTAGLALGVSCSLSVLGYVISYRSSMQKGFQAAGMAFYRFTAFRRIWTWITDRALLKNSMERASFHFVAQTVFRRQEHMLYWGSFVSVGIAVIYLVLHRSGSGILLNSSQHPHLLLSFALVISFFTLVGLRFIFSVPADLNANWIFRIIDKRKLGSANSGIRKFMLCTVSVPLLLVFAPCYLLIWDHRLVIYHISYVFILSWILIELLLLRFEKLPFTCTYLPGKANLKLLWPVYLLSCALYSFGTTVLELWLFRKIQRYGIFVLFAGCLLWILNRYRSLYLKRMSAIRFEEEPADALIVLTIEG